MLGTILCCVVVVFVLFLVLAATRPSAYRVERKVTVAAPADLVFGVLDDLHQFAGVLFLFGSAFDKIDPNMQKTFEGPASGVGQAYSWSGKEVGKGKLTIEESDPGQRVGMKLEFVKPMATTATCVLTVAGTPTGSSVTWSMAGDHNFIGKVLRMFMNTDKMLGADIEKGLAELKTVVEGKHASR